MSLVFLCLTALKNAILEQYFANLLNEKNMKNRCKNIKKWY
jgi:hypothetical protein